MTDMKTVSVLLDQETYDKVVQIQKDTNTFSRSNVLRDLVKKGLKANEK